MLDVDRAQTRLNEMLAELRARKSDLAVESEPLDRQWDEVAIQVEGDEALQGQGRLIDAEIASVQRALWRIQDGNYGTCVRCGEEIGQARLEARPEAALCIRCAKSSSSPAA